MPAAPLILDHAVQAAGAVPADSGPRAATLRPPPLPRRGERHDGLTPAQRHALVGAMLAAHVAGLWGLLQIREVRETVAAVAPMFVSLVAPPAPPKPVPPPPRQPQPKQPVSTKPPPVVIAAP